MIAVSSQSGYVALLSVLIVGAASLAIGLTLLVTGTDAQREVLTQQQSVQARNLATACIEEGLEQIWTSTSYIGTATLTLSTGSCSYTVANTGTSTRTVDASSTVGAAVRKVKASVTIGSSISITSWQDVQ